MDISSAVPLVIGTVPAGMAGRICGRVFSAVHLKKATDIYDPAIAGSVCSKTFILNENLVLQQKLLGVQQIEPYLTPQFVKQVGYIRTCNLSFPSYEVL